MRVALLAVISALGPTVGHTTAHAPFAKYLPGFPPKYQQKIRQVLGKGLSCGVDSSPAEDKAKTFRPTDYGADPSGESDSSLALRRTVEAMLNSSSGSRDLGGATLDLAGGKYLISEGLQIPPGYDNLEVRDGTLVAADSFPLGGTLLLIGDANAVKGSANKNINVMSLTLDGGGRAARAMGVLNCQYVNIGPSFMAYGFHQYGVQMNGTGGCFIHHSWMGEVAPFAPKDLTTSVSNLTSSVISLEGSEHDCYVKDVIIWSGRIGLRSQNGANEIEGLHTWNLDNLQGGIGILLEGGSGIVRGSYLDFCPLVVLDPKSVIVEGNLFLARANLVVQASKSKTVSGLVVTGMINAVTDTVIESNTADSILHVTSTRATLTKDLPVGADQIVLDFSDHLLFNTPIHEAYCSINAEEYIGHVVNMRQKKPIDRSITVLLSRAAQKKGGQVTCTVDQSQRTQPGH
eukprot:jgi/Bigna1/130472/aug1.11_g5180